MSLHPVMPLLGVNIDHVATLRQARGTTRYPEPLQAALTAETAGADAITIHLREDRRHIQERDVRLLAQSLQTRMNLELAVTDEMVAIACDVKPSDVCLVPEKREELTTEGGLDVAGQFDRVRQASEQMLSVGIRVSLFVDPDETQIRAAQESGSPVIELHTGAYADAADVQRQQEELEVIRHAAQFASGIGLRVNAGHGLHYHNVQPVAAIPVIEELNIGHSIVANAVFFGLASAVREMKQLMVAARKSSRAI